MTMRKHKPGLKYQYSNGMSRRLKQHQIHFVRRMARKWNLAINEIQDIYGMYFKGPKVKFNSFSKLARLTNHDIKGPILGIPNPGGSVSAAFREMKRNRIQAERANKGKSHV